MKKRILFVSVISAIILVLVSFTPSITADVSKANMDVVEEDVTPTPIALALQLIAKLGNHKDIESVETEEDVFQIIEGDEELNSIYEQLSGSDCGCEDDTTTLEWGFTVICVLLVPWLPFALMLLLKGGYNLLGQIVGTIGLALNCWSRHNFSV